MLVVQNQIIATDLDSISTEILQKVSKQNITLTSKVFLSVAV